MLLSISLLMAKPPAVLAYSVSSEVPGLGTHGADSRCSLNIHILKLSCPTKHSGTHFRRWSQETMSLRLSLAT